MYSPEIRPDKVRALYQLKLKTGRRMTELVDEAIAEYLKQQEDAREQSPAQGGD